MGSVPGLGPGPPEAADGAPLVVDLRNVYKPGEMVRHGFTYASIGRG
jgi:hypothetical protein